MPSKPMKLCHKTGCDNLTSKKYCDEHQHLEEQERKKTHKFYQQTRRDKEEQAFYSSTRWQKTRKIKLQKSPLCEMCLKENKVVQGTTIHHKREIKVGGNKTSLDNLMTVCTACHEKIHRR